jgi:hypothetical protein
MQVLVVNPTVVAFATGGAGVAELVDLDIPGRDGSKLDAFQKIVGGYIEGVSPPEGDCGVVVFFGDDGTGDSVSVPAHVVETARALMLLLDSEGR